MASVEAEEAEGEAAEEEVEIEGTEEIAKKLGIEPAEEE